MFCRAEAACGASGLRLRVLTVASSSVNAKRQQVCLGIGLVVRKRVCWCRPRCKPPPRCSCADFSRAVHQMDNLYAIIATALIGVVGVAIFLLNQPAEAKKKSKGPGLKPRDDWHAQ